MDKNVSSHHARTINRSTHSTRTKYRKNGVAIIITCIKNIAAAIVHFKRSHSIFTTKQGMAIGYFAWSNQVKN